MKKFLFIVICFVTMTITSANAQQKKTTYTLSQIDGIWLTTEAYNEKAKEWKTLEDNEVIGFAFTSVKSNGMNVALTNSGEGSIHFVYTFSNNVIRLYDIDNHSKLLITIYVSSLKRGQSFIGRLSTTISEYSVNFKFTHIE